MKKSIIEITAALREKDQSRRTMNMGLNLQYIKMIPLLGITALIIWVCLHTGNLLYIASVAVLTTLLSILALQFYPALRRFYLALPILLNLLIGAIGVDQAMLVDGVELCVKILKSECLFIICNLIISGTASTLYVKKRNHGM